MSTRWHPQTPQEPRTRGAAPADHTSPLAALAALGAARGWRHTAQVVALFAAVLGAWAVFLAALAVRALT